MSINFDKILSGPLIKTLIDASSPSKTIFDASSPSVSFRDNYTIQYMGKSDTNGMENFDVFSVENVLGKYKVRILPNAYSSDPREAFNSVQIKKTGWNKEWHNFRVTPDGSGIPYDKFYKSDFIHSLKMAITPSSKTYKDYKVTYMGKSDTKEMKEYDVFDVRNKTEAYKIRILLSEYRKNPQTFSLSNLGQIKKWDGEWYSFNGKPISQLPNLGMPSSDDSSPDSSNFAFSSTGRLSSTMQKYVPSLIKDNIGFDDPFLVPIGSSQLGQGYSVGFSVNKKFLNDNPLIYLAGIPGNNPEDEYLRWFLEGPVDPTRIDLSRKILVDLRCGDLFVLQKEKNIKDELWHAINDESARRRSSGINPNPWADPKPKRFEGSVYKEKYLKYKQKYLNLKN